MPKAKLMSSVEITEEPDGEQFKELLQELQARNPHENRRALEQGLRDKWRAGITEAQIVDAAGSSTPAARDRRPAAEDVAVLASRKC
jgi:hypothetical protein